MFVIDENSSEIGGGKFINVTPETCVAKGRYIKDLIPDSAQGFLDVLVIDSTGKTAKKRYFYPTLGKGFVQSDETLKKEMSKLTGILTNLARTFCGEDYKSKQALTIEEHVNNVVRDIKSVSAWNTKECWIKVVLDKADFPTLPPISPICYPATLSEVEVNNKGLSLNTQYDKVVRSGSPKPTADPVQKDFSSISGAETQEDSGKMPWDN